MICTTPSSVHKRDWQNNSAIPKLGKQGVKTKEMAYELV